ncbi:MAG: sulfotransferase, partial [Myxococcota bacterium]
LRYEDFASDPHAALARIGAFLGEDLSEVLTPDAAIRQPAPVRHTPGGNRVRLLREVQVRPDAGWMEHLPPVDRTLFWRRAGWLARRYGYAAEPA